MLSAVRVIQEKKNAGNLRKIIEKDKEREKIKMKDDNFLNTYFAESVGTFPIKSRISSFICEIKEKKEKCEIIETELKKRLDKTDLHPVFLSLNHLGAENEGNVVASESYSRCIAALTVEKNIILQESLYDGENMFQETSNKNKNNNGTDNNDNKNNNGYNFLPMNDSYSIDSNFDKIGVINISEKSGAMNDSEKEIRQFENRENDNTDSEKTLTYLQGVKRISCTEIERLRIAQLLREHEMAEKLKHEKRLLEERKLARQLLLRNEYTPHSRHPKRRIPISVNNTHTLKKSTVKIMNYATPNYQKNEKKVPVSKRDDGGAMKDGFGVESISSSMDNNEFNDSIVLPSEREEYVASEKSECEPEDERLPRYVR